MSATPRAPRRIAIVDEDPAVRAALAEALTRDRCSVRCFADGAAALTGLLAARDLDLVLADVASPAVDGIALCRALRARHAPDRLTIALMSSSDDEETIERALRSGADDVLAKPVHPPLLRAKLRAMFTATRPRPPAPEPEPLLFDPIPPCAFAGHRLEAVIGRGGSGTVYRARDDRSGAEVALKVLGTSASADTLLLEQLAREVETLRRLDSPHVVRLLRTGVERGRRFVVMTLVPGQPLDAVLRERGYVSSRLAAQVGADLCAAVEALHAAGLVHRDVKPHNVVLGPSGRATLLDLGLVRSSTDLSSTRGEVTGTAAYIAPEVVMGGPHHVGSDLYAVGVTVWQLLVGAPPFDGDTELEVLERIAIGAPAPEVRALRPDVPPPLSKLVADLMAPDDQARLARPDDARRRFAAVLRRLDAPAGV